MKNNQIGQLPHRYPMLLIDQVTAIDEGRRAAGAKLLGENEWFWPKSVTGKTAMPGVLIVEALAQVSGLAIDSEGQLGFLASIDRCTFRGQAFPGDLLVLESEIVRRKKSAVKSKVRALIGGKVICEAELLLVFRA